MCEPGRLPVINPQAVTRHLIDSQLVEVVYMEEDGG